MSKKNSKSFKPESREVKLIGEEKDIKDVQIGILDKENEMVEKAQRGDIKSFERIVFLYEGFVYNLAYNMFYNQLDAQDVTQEVFIKVYKNINSFKFNSKFKT
ncbi:MAG: helix-turn-helix domain-containing protein [Clostridia bacterium]|nr:helix-turn-helix domain-containing protein [Clostridia bacterium]